MTSAATTMLIVMSLLAPAKTWYAPNQPLTVNVTAEREAKLTLTRFDGTPVEASGDAVVNGEKTVDLKQLFPTLATPGTYVLYLVPKDGQLAEFLATPLVVQVRQDRRRGGPPGPMVVKIEPLRYVLMTTDAGPMTMAFYYDVAPNTVDNFLSLAEGGYFDGLSFHRIVPGFVIQGGDPRGDGLGGPGYEIDEEFNDRPHHEGVLSMARSQDPNSAGSQFFVCLDYTRTRQLDNQYTAFGKVVSGMEAVRAIAATPLADPEAGRPQTPPVIQKVEVKPVTSKDNPYKELLSPKPTP